MKYTLRAMLAVALLVGFYVVALAVVAGLVALVTLAALAGASGYALLKIGLPVALVVFAVGRGLFLRRGRRAEPDGVSVSALDQPLLWQEVRTLAHQVGTRAPDEIRFVPEVNAAVSEDTKLLGLVPGTRRLYVGVPLLMALSPLEMRSVLAHELGHYSRKHTALGPVTYRGKEAIARVWYELGPDSVLGRLVGWYGHLYVRIAHAVSRRQELEADQFSVQLAGPSAAASALRTLAPLDAAWQTFLARYGQLGNDHGKRPTPFFDGFAKLLADSSFVAALARYDDDAPEPETSVYDTHPPTSMRIATMAALPPVEVPSSAPDLLTDPERALAVVEDALFADSGLEPTTWDEATALTMADQVAERTQALARLVARAGLGTPTLGTAVGTLTNAWRTGLVDGYPPEEERAAVAGLVGDAAAHALVSTGAAHFRAGWTGRPRLTTTDGTEVDPWALAERAAEARDTAEFRAWAIAHGIALEAPLAADQNTTERGRPETDRILGVVSPLYRRGWRALVVTVDGIALVPLRIGEQYSVSISSAAGGIGWQRANDRIIERVSQTPLADLRAHRQTRFLGWDEVGQARLWVRKTRSQLRITLARGRSLTLKVERPVEVGEAWQALRHFLGGRFVVFR